VTEPFFYPESSIRDVQCSNGHVIRSPYLPTRCPFVADGPCNATSFEFIEEKRAAQLRGAKSRARKSTTESDTMKYAR
jgi:hypothetical protein